MACTGLFLDLKALIPVDEASIIMIHHLEEYNHSDIHPNPIFIKEEGVSPNKIITKYIKDYNSNEIILCTNII